jgi:hypothetical protein
LVKRAAVNKSGECFTDEIGIDGEQVLAATPGADMLAKLEHGFSVCKDRDVPKLARKIGRPVDELPTILRRCCGT